MLVSVERPATAAGAASRSPGGGGGEDAAAPSFRRRGLAAPSAADAASLPPSVVGIASVNDDDEPRLDPISPEDPLRAGDVLWFAGSAAAVGDLRKVPGLRMRESEEVQKIRERVHDRRLVQAVVARKGPLAGRTVGAVRFRTRYGAAVIAVRREGRRVREHPGKIRLQAGDVLLLEAGPTFLARKADNARSFALLSEVEDSAPPRLRMLVPALLLAVAMLAVFTAGVASLLVCALVAATVMVCVGILSQQEARDAVNWEIYVTIACAFGIGTALTNSGVAGGLAAFLVALGEAVNMGDAGLFGAVYFATFLISNVVTNNAAAALIFPIAMDAAEQFGTDRLLMSYCIMLAASASFMSPFGYTTNLMIYGPGAYKVRQAADAKRYEIPCSSFSPPPPPSSLSRNGTMAALTPPLPIILQSPPFNMNYVAVQRFPKHRYPDAVGPLDPISSATLTGGRSSVVRQLDYRSLDPCSYRCLPGRQF